ncbi:MAG: MBL fold metallo-hydrolase [Candidatus Aminicenantales bacterium]
MNDRSSLRMIVVYDNNPFDERLKTDWGFSCLVEGLEKSILFDTGGSGEILLSNMEKLGIRPEKIDVVVLSHAHRDHTGGLEDLLVRNSNIEVWLPYFFPADFKDKIRKMGARVVEVEKRAEICKGASTSGVIEGWIKEQSLVLDTKKRLIVITGCAHPRIVNILIKVKELFKKDIHLVFGGFHLAGFYKAEIKEIIAKFRSLGVQKVGPCHCSGEDARQLFAEEYQEDFIKIGVGKEIKIQ